MYRMRRISRHSRSVLLGWLVLACLTIAACAPRAEPPEPADFQRIVCATPALVELVYALGAGSRVAAVSDYTVHPPEALEKPRIGGWMDPNREQLLALRADLILTQGEHPALTAFAKAHAIPLRSFRIESLSDISAAIRQLGELLDIPEAAGAALERLRSDQEALLAQVKGLPLVRTALILGRLPGSLEGLTTIGRDTFLSELLLLAGGTNIFADAAGAYPKISKESLLARNPEVILEVNPGGWPPHASAHLAADWQALAKVDAVQHGRLYFLEDDFLLIPGPRAVAIARRFVEFLHPELSDE